MSDLLVTVSPNTVLKAGYPFQDPELLEYEIVSQVYPLCFCRFHLGLHDLPCSRGLELQCWFVVQQPVEASPKKLKTQTISLALNLWEQVCLCIELKCLQQSKLWAVELGHQVV